jgi:hypothetical protein
MNQGDVEVSQIRVNIVLFGHCDSLSKTDSWSTANNQIKLN